MIKMNKKGKIKVLNCNALRRKWTVTEAAEKKYIFIYTAMIY